MYRRKDWSDNARKLISFLNADLLQLRMGCAPDVCSFVAKELWLKVLKVHPELPWVHFTCKCGRCLGVIRRLHEVWGQP